MKIVRMFLPVVFSCSALMASAANYYFSSTTGDDLRTPAQAQHVNTPWKTLNKLNTFFSNLNGGDTIFLKKGDTFYGSMTISKSGLPGQPIVISSYGNGNMPVISGLVPVSGWNKNKDGIYESNLEIEDLPLNMVTLNNIEYAMGRYPNYQAGGKGWKTIASHIANNSIADNSLAPNPDWTGGEAVIRKNHYVIDRNKITAHAGNILSYTSGTHYAPANGFGYFIQNHLATLDQFGEWYYDSSSKKLLVYFGSSVSNTFNVKASNINTLITSRKHDYISFNNLLLEGSNQKGFYLYYSNHISIKNCSIIFSGGDAIDGFNTESLSVENCSINYSNNNALNLSGACNNTSILNNSIKNTGLFEGMAGNSSLTFSGINITGDHNIIKYNHIDSTGYTAIRFDGSYCEVLNNYIDNFCFIKDDGGGILTNNNNAPVARQDQKITGNIILHGIGAPGGTNSSVSMANGIYLDDNSANIEVAGNTVAYTTNAGLLLHNSHDILVKNNTFYGNATQMILQKDAASVALVRDNIVVNNIFVSKDATQFTASFFTNSNATDIDSFGRIDSNYYSRPIDDSVTISTSYVDKPVGKINKFYSLEEWKSGYNKDLSSKRPSFQLSAFKINDLGKVNKVPNGNFDKNQPGINGFRCKTAWKNSGVLDGGYLQVTSLPNFPDSYITIPVGNIQAGKNYILRFTLAGAGSNEKTIGIYLRANGAPYTNLAQKVYRNIIGARHNYEIGFSAVKDDPNALLIFALNEPNVTYSIDNIQLYEANATITRPEDHLLFVYNPGNSPKKLSLKGSYKDIKNEAYLNSIVLAPYSSAILMKQN